MKKMSVVFVVCFEGNKKYVMMGKQAPGKKLAGFRNGYGGKCEMLAQEDREETTLECAVRELREETRLSAESEPASKSEIDVSVSDLKKIGNIVNGDKYVDFFVLVLKDKISIADNDEVIDVKWFDLDNPEMFVNEMLSGDDIIIDELIRYAEDPDEYKEFKIDKTENVELNKQVENIFGFPGMK